MYDLVGEADAGNEKAGIDISKYRSGFSKIVREGEYNSVNRPIVEKDD